jgi:hypothetical protein
VSSHLTLRLNTLIDVDSLVLETFPSESLLMLSVGVGFPSTVHLISVDCPSSMSNLYLLITGFDKSTSNQKKNK